METIISRRNGTVIAYGNSMGLSLREELIDLGVNINQEVQISLMKNSKGKQAIVIEKVGE